MGFLDVLDVGCTHQKLSFRSRFEALAVVLQRHRRRNATSSVAGCGHEFLYGNETRSYVKRPLYAGKVWYLAGRRVVPLVSVGRLSRSAGGSVRSGVVGAGAPQRRLVGIVRCDRPSCGSPAPPAWPSRNRIPRCSRCTQVAPAGSANFLLCLGNAIGRRRMRSKGLATACPASSFPGP